MKEKNSPVERDILSRGDDSGFQIWMERKAGHSMSWSVLVLTLLTVAGMAAALQWMFAGEADYRILAGIVVIASLWGYVLRSSRKRLIAGVAIQIVVIVLAVILTGSRIVAGAMDFVNQIVAQYNYVTGLSIDYFVVPQCPDHMTAYYLFMACLVSVMAVYLAQVISTRHPMILFLCWMPLLAGSIFLELYLGGILIAWAVVSILGTFAVSQGKGSQDRVYAVSFCVLLAVLGGLGTLYYQKASYQPSERIAAMKESVTEQMDEVRYGQTDYPEGKLDREVSGSDEIRLRVTLPQQATLYLKGYTGSVFDGHKWSLLEDSSYSEKYEGMIREYQENGFHPLAQQSCYFRADKTAGGEQADVTDMDVTIENLSASRKYVYLPYGVTFDSLLILQGAKQDICVRGVDEQREKKLTLAVESTPQDSLITYGGASWVDEEYDINQQTGAYRMAESDYRKFVQEHYLHVDTPSELTENLPADSRNLAEITGQIRETLYQQGKNEDWISVQYATYGTQMFRYCGIPARYVEGYLVRGKGQVEVKASQAHAWTEIYKNGIGWIPVDVTPGFYKELPSQQEDRIRQSSRSAQNPQNKQQDQQKAEQNKEPWKLWVRILFVVLGVILGVLLLIVLTIWIRRQVCMRRRRRQMEDADRLNRIRAMSGYLLDLSQYLDRSEEELPEQTRNVLQILWFGHEPEKLLDQEQECQIRQTVRAWQSDAWEGAGRWRRLRLRYQYLLEYPVTQE